MINEPASQAEASRRALHALACATERMDDREEIGAVLASLSSATESFSESLHQIASAHDRRRDRGNHQRAQSAGSPEYPMSWELHRAGEILHQVSNLLRHAHGAASHPEQLRLAPVATNRSVPGPTGLGL